MVRRRPMRTDKFFIFTEGRTEEVYFGSDSFRSETKSLTVNPERKRFEGTDAGTYKRWISSLRDSGRIRPGDRVWIVLDRDDNRGEDKTAVLSGLALSNASAWRFRTPSSRSGACCTSCSSTTGLTSRTWPGCSRTTSV